MRPTISIRSGITFQHEVGFMELDQKTSKLLILFLSVNLVAAALGFAAVILFGAIAGLIVFTVLVIALPLLLQYLYISKKNI